MSENDEFQQMINDSIGVVPEATPIVDVNPDDKSNANDSKNNNPENSENTITEKKEDVEIKPISTNAEIDYKAKLSEILGENITEITDDTFTKIKSIKENTVKEYQSKIDEYEDKIKNTKPTYINEKLARIDKLQRITNIEDIGLLSSLASKDPKKMTSYEAIKTAFIINNPEFDNEDDVNDYLLNKLGIDSLEDIDTLTGSDKIKLQQEAKIAKAEINKIYTELNVEDSKNEDIKQKNEVFKKAWAEVGTNIEKELKEINIPIIKDGKEDVYMKYSAMELKPYIQDMISYLANDNKELTEANLKVGLTYLENRYFLDNKAQIISSIVAKERSATIDEYELKYNNSKPLDSTTEIVSGSEKKDVGEAYVDWLRK